MPMSIRVTPWSLFGRNDLIGVLENMATDDQMTAGIEHLLQLEVHQATMLLAVHYGNDLESAVKELERITAKYSKTEAAPRQPTYQPSGAVRRYRRTRLVVLALISSVSLRV